MNIEKNLEDLRRFAKKHGIEAAKERVRDIRAVADAAEVEIKNLSGEGSL